MIGNVFGTTEENEANCNLIKSAPDMLEALKLVDRKLALLTEDEIIELVGKGVVKMVKLALAKATGGNE
jgi:hypothetical protein